MEENGQSSNLFEKATISAGDPTMESGLTLDEEGKEEKSASPCTDRRWGTSQFQVFKNGRTDGVSPACSQVWLKAGLD